MSLESVRDKCPPVYHVLRLLSLFDPEEIPQFHLWDWRDETSDGLSLRKPSTFKGILYKLTCQVLPPKSLTGTPKPTLFNKDNIAESIRNLADYSLVRKMDGGVLWMHDLTRQYAKSEIPAGELSTWLGQAVDLLSNAFPLKDRSPEERSMVTVFLSQAESLIQQCEKNNVPRTEYAELRALCGMCLHNRRRFQAAKEHYISSLEVYTEMKGARNVRTIALRHRLGWTI